MFSTSHVRAEEIRAVRFAASKERELRTSRTGGGKYLLRIYIVTVII